MTWVALPVTNVFKCVRDKSTLAVGVEPVHVVSLRVARS